MKKMNKKGFTLIELLAVIVILGVLLSIAAPAVSKYINSSKKSTYIVDIKNYADSVRASALNGEFSMPVSTNHATAYTFDKVYEYLEKGGKTSPYGEEFKTDQSYVIIVNEGTPEAPKYRYYIFAIDEGGYGIGIATDNSPAAIKYEDLKDNNVIRLDSTLTVPSASSEEVTINGIDHSIIIDRINYMPGENSSTVE